MKIHRLTPSCRRGLPFLVHSLRTFQRAFPIPVQGHIWIHNDSGDPILRSELPASIGLIPGDRRPAGLPFLRSPQGVLSEFKFWRRFIDSGYAEPDDWICVADDDVYWGSQATTQLLETAQDHEMDLVFSGNTDPLHLSGPVSFIRYRNFKFAVHEMNARIRKAGDVAHASWVESGLPFARDAYLGFHYGLATPADCRWRIPHDEWYYACDVAGVRRFFRDPKSVPPDALFLHAHHGDPEDKGRRALLAKGLDKIDDLR